MLDKDLYLFMLDGGGVCNLSVFIILQYLIEIINPKISPKPYKYFDIIGGISTNRLIITLYIIFKLIY